MSWFTVALRHAGLGGVLDAIEGAEKAPSPANIVAAGEAIVTAAPHMATVAPEVVGQMAGDTVAAALNKFAPGAEPVAMQTLAPFLSDLESLATAFLEKVIPGQQSQAQTEQ